MFILILHVYVWIRVMQAIIRYISIIGLISIKEISCENIMALSLRKSMPNLDTDIHHTYISLITIFGKKTRAFYFFLAIVLIIVNKEIELINDQH